MTWFPVIEGAPPTGWFYYAPYPGTFAYLIASWTAKCPLAGGPVEVQSDCPFCTKPISLATGNTFITQADVSVPGLGGGLHLVRRWNSIWPSTQMAMQVGIFGPNWRSTYEEQVFHGSDGNMKYSRGDGNFWSFAQGSSPANVVSPGNVIATLTSGSTYWTVTFQDGEQRLFNNITGLLTTIVDRNGNQTQIVYDGSNRLFTITDPALRHLTFNYPNGSSRLVSSVTSDVGLTVGYKYDAQNRLWVVTMPDLSTLTFAYESHSLIASVTDSQGKVLESHTYDGNGRGLTASQAGGVNAVTLTYPQ